MPDDVDAILLLPMPVELGELLRMLGALTNYSAARIDTWSDDQGEATGWLQVELVLEDDGISEAAPEPPGAGGLA